MKALSFIRAHAFPLLCLLVACAFVLTGHTAAAAIALGGASAPTKGLFRYNTRQRFQKVGTQAYGANGTVTQTFPRVGFLSRVIVQFRGTVTLSGAGTLADLGPWNLVNRFRLLANIGTAQIVDVSGYGAYLVSCLQEGAFKPDASGIGATTPNADIYVAPVAGGANTWCLTWILPVASNTGTNFEAGLINLQAPDITVTLDIVTGALTDPAALTTGISGNFHIYYEYFEMPDPRAVELPPACIVRTLEEQQVISAVGEQIYTVPRMGSLMQLWHLVRLNGARNSSNVDEFAIRANKTDTIYRMERQARSVITRLQTGIDPPTGAFLHDYFHSEEGMSEGDVRDFIDTEALTTLESVVTVNSGATIGTAYLNSIRRIFQLLA